MKYCHKLTQFIIVTGFSLQILAGAKITKQEAYKRGAELGTIHWLEYLLGLEFDELANPRHFRQYAKNNKMDEIIRHTNNVNHPKEALRGLYDSLKKVNMAKYCSDRVARASAFEMFDVQIEHLENLINMPACQWQKYVENMGMKMAHAIRDPLCVYVFMNRLTPFISNEILEKASKEAACTNTYVVKDEALSRMLQKSQGNESCS